MSTTSSLVNVFDGSFIEKLLDDNNEPYHFEKNFDEKVNCRYDVCKACGGRCCKRCGCCFSPDDFKDLSFDGLLKEIHKGYITLEVVDGDLFYINRPIWIVRMRNINGPVVVDKLFGRKNGQCVALRDNGCAFDYEHRPSGGRLLVPGAKGYGIDCHSSYDMRETLREWRAHQNALVELAHLLNGADFACKI